MRVFYAIIMCIGIALQFWACAVNPKGAVSSPDDPPFKMVTTGPYRWLKHPMYWGNGLTVVGMAGLAAGVWNALAAAGIMDLLMRDWVKREENR